MNFAPGTTCPKARDAGRFVVCAIALVMGCGGTTLSDPSEDPNPQLPELSVPRTLPDLRVYPDITMGEGTVEEGIEALNAYRALAGLPPVVMDNTWSSACTGHLRYLDYASNVDHAGACVLMHDEPDETNPHHAAFHEKAAAGALLACDRSSESQLSLGRAVDRWINSLYHRLPLLNPGLVRVGGATYEGFVCLHYESGTLPLDEPTRVEWPPAQALDVPRSFVGRERPCPSTPSDPMGTSALACPPAGFILSATWYGLEGCYPFSDASPPRLEIADSGAPVALLQWYADGSLAHDPAPGLIPQTVAWVPAVALEEGTRYRATVQGKSWTFRTGSRLE